MRVLLHAGPAAVILAVAVMASAADTARSTTTSWAPACTATSSTGSGAFFDLRPDTAAKTVAGKGRGITVSKDYHARGYDYGKNFTLNICGSVVEPVTDVVGVKKHLWANVSAYYVDHGSVYSTGSEAMDLRSRGRKLVLQYAGGSPCGDKSTKDAGSGQLAHIAKPLADDAKDTDKDTDKTAARQKSTTISFLCDRDPGNSQASVSYVGSDPDECAYFFEARSVHACAQAEPHKPGSVGPGSVFGIILLIAILVYVLGGVFYNRTVANARGWRQLPNYSLWAGIWNFIAGMFIWLISSCSRHLPSRRGYSHLNSNAGVRHRNSDAENRLIDQLDEEWDD